MEKHSAWGWTRYSIEDYKEQNLSINIKCQKWEDNKKEVCTCINEEHEICQLMCLKYLID